MLFTFTTAGCRHGEGNGLHRRCQSMARPHGRVSPAYASFAMAPRLDRRDCIGLHLLVADRSCPSLFHTREQKNGLLESSRPLVEQDGADAVQNGTDAGPDGTPWFSVR